MPKKQSLHVPSPEVISQESVAIYPGDLYDVDPGERRQGFVRPNASPGRLARHAFEQRPSRVAYNLPSGLLRGEAGDAHLNLVARHLPDLERHLDIEPFDSALQNFPVRTATHKETLPFWKEWDRFIQQVPDEVLDEWEGESGFTSRSGTFIPRSEAPGTLGGGESILLAGREESRDPARQKEIARAESVEQRDSNRRKLRASRAHAGMRAMREERNALSGFAWNSPRIQTLTRRMGRLASAAKRAGVMGLATVGSIPAVQNVLDGLEQRAEEKYGIE